MEVEKRIKCDLRSGNPPEVLNVKILKIMTKLCIRSDDTKKDCLLTPFSMVKQLSLSKILVL
jgi:hypothetical protein